MTLKILPNSQYYLPKWSPVFTIFTSSCRIACDRDESALTPVAPVLLTPPPYSITCIQISEICHTSGTSWNRSHDKELLLSTCALSMPTLLNYPSQTKSHSLLYGSGNLPDRKNNVENTTHMSHLFWLTWGHFAGYLTHLH